MTENKTDINESDTTPRELIERITTHSDMNQQDIANELGVSQPSVSNWKYGRGQLDPAYYRQLREICTRVSPPPRSESDEPTEQEIDPAVIHRPDRSIREYDRLTTEMVTEAGVTVQFSGTVEHIEERPDGSKNIWIWSDIYPDECLLAVREHAGSVFVQQDVQLGPDGDRTVVSLSAIEYLSYRDDELAYWLWAMDMDDRGAAPDIPQRVQSPSRKQAI